MISAVQSIDTLANSLGKLAQAKQQSGLKSAKGKENKQQKSVSEGITPLHYHTGFTYLV